MAINQAANETTVAINQAADETTVAINKATDDSTSAANTNAMNLTNVMTQMAHDERQQWKKDQAANKTQEEALANALNASQFEEIATAEAAACAQLKKDNPGDSAAIAAACINRDPDSANIGLVEAPPYISTPSVSAGYYRAPAPPPAP